MSAPDGAFGQRYLSPYYCGGRDASNGIAAGSLRTLKAKQVAFRTTCFGWTRWSKNAKDMTALSFDVFSRGKS